MISKRLAFIVIIGIALLFTRSNAATGWSHLSIPNGIREIGMAEAGVGIRGNNPYWNPANWSGSNLDIWLQMFNWMPDGNGNFTGVRTKQSWGGFGAWYMYHGWEGFEARQQPGEKDGNFAIRHLIFAVGSSYDLSQNTSIGLTYKTTLDDIYGNRLETWNVFDLGAISSFNNWEYGISLRNIGADRDGWSFPTVLQAGVARNYEFSMLQVKEALDFVVPKDRSVSLNFGMELLWEKLIGLRFGYKTDKDLGGFATGVSLYHKGYSFDIAYVPNNNNIGSSTRFGIKIDL